MNMKGQGVSTICEIRKPQELTGNEKFKDLSRNEKKSGNSCEEKNSFCPEKPRHDNVGDDSPGGEEEMVSFGESASAEDCDPPLERWTALPRFTGTRPTVGNFTISRYSPAEWRNRHQEILKDSTYQIREAKNHEYKTNLLGSQICSQIDKQQLDNSLLLRSRAGEIFHWKTELKFVGEEVESEILKIQGEIGRLSNCFRAVETIKNMDRDIQRIRDSRLHSDLVHDTLAEEIVKEEKLCNDILNLYTRCIDETKMQSIELKDAKQRLEHDWSDKSQTYDIDSTCVGLKNDSEGLQWKPGSLQVSQDQSSPEGHTTFVKQSIIYAKTAVNRSQVLRANMIENSSTCLKDLRRQAAAVEMALADQIVELTEAIRRLEAALNNCLKRLADNDMLINKTNAVIRGIDGPMKCAQTRLGMRLIRENIESCRDHSQNGLIDEVKNVAEGTTALSGQVKMACDSTDSLIELRKKLENELLVKKNSLWIDGKRCKSMRMHYPAINSLSGY